MPRRDHPNRWRGRTLVKQAAANKNPAAGFTTPKDDPPGTFSTRWRGTRYRPDRGSIASTASAKTRHPVVLMNRAST